MLRRSEALLTCPQVVAEQVLERILVYYRTKQSLQVLQMTAESFRQYAEPLNQQWVVAQGS